MFYYAVCWARSIPVCASTTGTRRGETIVLRRQDDDWDNNVLSIKQTVQ